MGRRSDMTGETFEYAIKKDVRNNPIVREVDASGIGDVALGGRRPVSRGRARLLVWRQVELLA